MSGWKLNGLNPWPFGEKLQSKSLEKSVRTKTQKHLLSSKEIPCVWRDLLVRRARLHNKPACLPRPTKTTEQVLSHWADRCRGLREFNYCAVIPACRSLSPSGQGKAEDRKGKLKKVVRKSELVSDRTSLCIAHWLPFILDGVISYTYKWKEWAQGGAVEPHLVFIPTSISLQCDGDKWQKHRECVVREAGLAIKCQSGLKKNVRNETVCV